MSSAVSRMLILHPDCFCGDSFFRPRLAHRRLGPFKEVDATSTRGNPEQVKAEILSGDYGVILVCDLSTNHHWLDDIMLTLISTLECKPNVAIVRVVILYVCRIRFTSKFSSALKSFVSAGGIVAFPNCDGGTLCR